MTDRRGPEAQRGGAAQGTGSPKGRRIDLPVLPCICWQATADIYALLAQCDGFDWDDGNAPKVRARHLVEPGECEQVFFGMPLLVSADLPHSRTEVGWA